MQIVERDKTNILLNLLNERYNASHNMRERSVRFTIWILGFAIALVWILLGKDTLTIHQKWILTLLVIVIGGITFWFLYAIKVGFDNNRKVMVDIEEALGCYTKGTYVDSKALFPNEYKEIKKWYRFSHFLSIYILLIPIGILIICLILLGPTQQSHRPNDSPVQGQKIEKK